MGVVERRTFLLAAAGTGAGLGLAACGGGTTGAPVGPAAIASREAARAASGATRRLALRAQPTQVDLGGTVVSTWAYGSTIPGQAFRATAGDRVLIDFRNDLPEPTSVHWHGLAIRNDMDGVPGLTTPETEPGGGFSFDFVVPDPGTHWFHPHHGLQLDHGLYAPFVIDDPAEPGDYDAEWVLVLDDWTDGVGPDAKQIMEGLVAAGGSGDGMAGMDMGMGGMAGMGGMGMDSGDVTYPFFLVNGRVPSDPETLAARAGDRVRLRIINAAADTVFIVALGGHDLLVTHTDGFPVQPVAAPALRIGMGERYDALVTLGDGVFAFAAAPEGKTGLARALIRTGAGSVPPESARPAELAAFPLTVDALTSVESVRLPGRSPDAVQDVLLSGSMAPYVWTINGTTYQDTIPLT
ncbi:MAG: multicopper oxidase family protein, partial [Candidatus Nanopelagicales bacterium]